MAAAKELGYEFSIAALEQSKAEGEELDMEELEQVAGGDGSNQPEYCAYIEEGDRTDAKGHEWWCWTGWHCLATMLHTNADDDDAVMCWSDYRCVLSSK